jgi:hypothetical protein
VAAHKNKQRMIHRYLAWRKTVPLFWRILADIGMIVLLYYAVTTAVYMLILILPLFAFLGLAKAGGKSTDSDDDEQYTHEQMGGQRPGQGTTGFYN